MFKIKVVQDICNSNFHRVGALVISKKHLLHDKMVWFTDHLDGNYTVEVEGSPQSLRLKKLHKNTKYVKYVNGERRQAGHKTRWAAIERSHWSGSLQSIGVIALGKTVEEAFARAIPRVWI